MPRDKLVSPPPVRLGMYDGLKKLHARVRPPATMFCAMRVPFDAQYSNSTITLTLGHIANESSQALTTVLPDFSDTQSAGHGSTISRAHEVMAQRMCGHPHPRNQGDDTTQLALKWSPCRLELRKKVSHRLVKGMRQLPIQTESGHR